MAFILALLAGAVLAQLTPSLIARDAFTPCRIKCNQPDTLNTTKCDPNRSSGCNITTFRCTLADSITGTNLTAQLITFTMTPYAELMPGSKDGKVRVNIIYTDARPFELSGDIQLWMLNAGTTNTYTFTGRQYEVNFVFDATMQTYVFHGLAAGTYVAVYWDDGGTQQALGNPEISQKVQVLDVFTQEVDLTVVPMPLDQYNTNYQLFTRLYISYELLGPPGFQTVLTNCCSNPLCNRCLFWEERTDQGNLKNAKTQLETIPAAMVGLFVDSMFKFKTFPGPCCSRRTRTTARLVYGGPFPLFPTSYMDYWVYDSKQRYGFGTTLGSSRTLALARVYLDDQQGGQNPAFAYQILVTANIATPLISNPYPPCPWMTAVQNTLTRLDAQTDLLTVYALRRIYCECTTGLVACGPPTSDLYVSRAFRTGSRMYLGNFDKFEDYEMIQNRGDYLDLYASGDIFGRVYTVDVDFAVHLNNGAASDYPCAVTDNDYTQAASFSHVFNSHSTGTYIAGSIFADIALDTAEARDFYSVGPGQGNQCVFNGISGLNYANCIGSIQPKNGALPPYQLGEGAGQFHPENTMQAGTSVSPMAGYGFQANPCNCMNRNGAMMYQNIFSGSCTTADHRLSPYIETCVSSFDTTFGPVFEWDNDIFERSVTMCCNARASGLDGAYYSGNDYDYTDTEQMKYEVDIHTGLKPGAGASPQANVPATSGGDLDYSFQNYINTQWSGNTFFDMYQTANSGAEPDGDVVAGMEEFESDGHPFELYRAIDSHNSFCPDDPAAACLYNRQLVQAGGLNVRTWGGRQHDFVLNGLTPVHFHMYVFNPAHFELPQGWNVAFTDPTLLFAGLYNVSMIFGYYGLDTFAMRMDIRNPFNDAEFSGVVNYWYRILESVTVYARFKVVPEIEFYGFSQVHFPEPPAFQATIRVTFRVSCPDVNMDISNDNAPGQIGFCAQTWVITNQDMDPILTRIVSMDPPGLTISETQPSFPLNADQILPDVPTSAVFTVEINYNDGDEIIWLFYPKSEAEQPAGNFGFCGAAAQPAFGPYSPIPLHYSVGVFQPLQAAFTVTVPLYSRTLNPMSVSIRSVPPACEYNQPEMLLCAFCGDPFVYASPIAQNLAEADITGNPLDFGQNVNYWSVWDIAGAIIEGFAVFFQPYDADTTVTVYDRVSVQAGLTPPPPVVVPDNPNPLVRNVACANTNATCFTADDSTNVTGILGVDYSGIDQNHFCADGVNQDLLTPRLVFFNPFTFADQVGAIYCNRTTQFIDVFIQELQSKALFAMQLECLVTETGFYTYTVRYGKSLAALLSEDNFPCYERFITYAIILTSFEASPGTLYRIPGCTRPDNCCYTLNITVFGNTGSTEDIVNLATCQDPEHLECLYEITVSPPPSNDTFHGLCLGETYTFTVQSPAALVANRKEATLGTFFQFPWRCPSSFLITLPTEGFSPVGVTVTNGDCAVLGSSVELSFTYTNPSCLNAISPANINPDCRFYLWFAFEPITTVSPYGSHPARKSTPIQLTGANAATYNLEDIVNFPQILNDPGFTSVPDGIYIAYFWVTTSAAHGNPDAIGAADARNEVATRIKVLFNSEDGLKIIRKTLFFPQCPATFNDTLTKSIADTAINLGIVIRDQNFNGPYNLTFYTPTGKLISNHTFTVEEVCGPVCILPNVSCTVCDVLVRDQGIVATLYIGTGVSSPGEQGLYIVSVTAEATGCTATYAEEIIPLNSFTAEVSCQSPRCFGTQDGLIYSFVKGGTQIPFLLSELIQNSDLTVQVARYHYEWVILITAGNLTLNNTIFNQTYLPAVTQGMYTLIVTDYNGCTATATCVLIPRHTPIELELIGSQSANCSYQQGAITVQVVNNTGVPPFTLYKVGPNPHPVMTTNGFVLMDRSVQLGTNFFYTVCDATNCCSPLLNLSLAAPQVFTVRIQVLRIPCSATLNSGIITAVVSPASYNVPTFSAATFTWFFNGAQIPSLTGPTITSAGAGVYQVIATSPFGCTSSDTIGLFAATNLQALFARSPCNVVPSTITGAIIGGNGPPYTLSINPADGIVMVDNADVLAGRPVTSFIVAQLPPQQTLFLTFTDSGGCIIRERSDGCRVPLNETLITPSASPAPHHRRAKNHNNTALMLIIILTVMGVLLMSALCCWLVTIFYIQRSARRKELAGAQEEKRL